MVKEAAGRLFPTYDKGGRNRKYFVYLPKSLVEDRACPFKIEKSTKVKIRFNKEQIIIEKITSP